MSPSLVRMSSIAISGFASSADFSSLAIAGTGVSAGFSSLAIMGVGVSAGFVTSAGVSSSPWQAMANAAKTKAITANPINGFRLLVIHDAAKVRNDEKLGQGRGVRVAPNPAPA